MNAAREAFEDAEENLRCEFGTEQFKLGKHVIEARTTSGEMGIDYGDDGPRESDDNVRAIFFKSDFPGKPRESQKITWCRECGEIKMQVENISGSQITSPVWRLDLRAV